MGEVALTSKQMNAIKAVDEQLVKAGLTSYTKMEDTLYGALTMANDGVVLGQQLKALLEQSEKRIKELEVANGECEQPELQGV